MLGHDTEVACLIAASSEIIEKQLSRRVLIAIQDGPFPQTFNFLLKIYIFISFNEGCPRGQEFLIDTGKQDYILNSAPSSVLAGPFGEEVLGDLTHCKPLAVL